jgi:hypothetical protein
MAVINLGNLKFTWKGNWAVSTAYAKDDIVRYGASAYVCVTSHTSGTTYAANSSKFELMASGIEFGGVYNPSTLYQTNEIVTYGGATYIALQESTGRTPSSNPTYWSSLVGGIEFIDVYNSGTAYVSGDIVTYGGYNYIATTDTTGNVPTNLSYWKLFNKGLSLVGSYDSGIIYKPGEVVTYGANGYICILTTTAGTVPTNGTYWTKLTAGITALGTYSGSTGYKPGDIVQFGGYLYSAIQTTTGNAPTNTAYWSQTSTGFVWSGTYSGSTTYQKGEVVNYNGSSFVSISFTNLNQTPDVSTSYWTLMMQGSANNVYTTAGDIAYRNNSAIVRLPVGSSGQVLSINNSTGLPVWENNDLANNVYYVSQNGVDAANYGRTLGRPFASLQYATQNVTTPCTIFVKAGEYFEQLPITVPASCAIVGDSLRNTFISPKATGVSLDASPVANNRSTMFLLSDSTLVKQITVKGMTGFALSGTDPQDITTATIGGVFFRLNPASPILNKSPYITDCSAFSTGGTGVIVDGSVHASGNKSMVFHAFTNINDLGVGFWMANNAKAEIVSCFTYYCHFGYAVSGGAKIRSLNGNNSYGTYGVVSRGYDTSETPITATIYGDQIAYNSNSLSGNGFTTADTIQGLTSGARGTITNVQSGSYKVYYKKIGSPNFASGETIVGSSTGTSAVVASGGNTGQKGFVVVVTGLTSAPIIGTSIEFTGDASSYVIQTVGTYVNSSSIVQIVLAQEKVTASLDGTAVRVRANFSNARLTGHDFLSIGTGGTATTNYPGYPTQASAVGNQTIEVFPGRIFYISTDQDGNFKVGNYFAVNQATGTATLNANAFNLSGLSALRLGSIGAQLGELISEFSSDVTLGADVNTKVPTQHAVKYYVDNKFNTSLPSSLSVGTSPTTTVALRDITNTNAGTGATTDLVNITIAGVQVGQFTNTKFTYTPGGNTAFEASRYYMQVPVGDISTRPAGVAGYMRYNTELKTFEGYSNSQWTSVGGGNPWVIKTATYTAVNNDRLMVDTSGGAFTITLPASPAIGDTIRFMDVAGTFNTNNLTIARNGSVIMSDAQNMTVNTKNASFSLVFSNATYGWRLGEA